MPTRRGWTVAMMLAAPLLLLALTAATHLAQPAQALNSARRATVREERQAARALRHAATLAHLAEMHPAGGATKEVTNAVVTIGCTGITWEYRGFPEAPGNSLTERIEIKQVRQPPIEVTFDGPTGTSVTPFNAPPGHYTIDAHARWTHLSANGVHGGFDLHTEVHCNPAPAMTADKLQKVDGTSGAFTSGALNATIGETIDYEVLVANTGNVPLTLGAFTDARCDTGTVTGGTEGEPLAPGATTTFLCSHLLTAADSGSFTNTVTLVGTPPSGGGTPVTVPTNTVVTEVPPAPETPVTTPPGESEVAGSKTSQAPTTTTTTTTTTGNENAKGGVLAFSSVLPSALKGPQGCVRRSFTASIKSANVATVTFYLDGRKLKTLTGKNAKHGLLTIRINPASLKTGMHKLVAKIAMALPTSASTKPAHVSRRLSVLRCHAALLTPKFTG